MDKALTVKGSEYKGAVYCEELDQYFSSVSDYFESALDSSKDCSHVKFLWSCTTEDWLGLDLDDLLDSALSEHHEGAEENVVDFKELSDFLKGWNNKQTIKSYFVDYTTKIRL